MKKSKHHLKKYSIFALFFLFSTIFWSQESISEIIQTSKTAKQTDNVLYFIDFWATWCAPCINVSKYLEVLQEQNPDNFYIISLSKENPEVVNQFFKKHSTSLAVAIDFGGQTFRKYNIKSLPYGVLLNADGITLWKGHPADFKNAHIKKYLKKNHKKAALSNMFNVVQKVSVVEKVYQPKSDFDFFEIERMIGQSFQIKHNESYIELKGSLQHILAYALKVSVDQVKMLPNINKYYHMFFKHNSEAFNMMSKQIIDKLQLEKIDEITNGNAIVLDIENPTFWDTNQIDWGSNSFKYLIDDTQIQADDMKLKDIIYKLSTVLEMPIVIKQKNIDNDKHDWQIHYKFYSLMQADLYDNYGIIASKKLVNYPQYIIKK
ncbi:MAG: TlpA family protein disulfide reductase [Flavobacteriaceae bacterium]|nr:TlpA family protein disulfide reductase [Flavobacteriaceae bacterium]